MKHRPVAELGDKPKAKDYGDLIRELVELADELQRNGMARQAKTVRNGVTALRTLKEVMK